MNLTILGTGNATVTHCYNTCFVLEEKGQYLLVDGGGGNGLLQQLERANLRWQDMRTVFVTHKHIDHLLGIIWLMRMMCQSWRRGTYDGEATIYGHDEVIGLLRSMATSLLAAKDNRYLDDKLHLITVEDGDKHTLIGHDVTFFDIRSTKAKQFGFAMELSDGRLTCCGDEPCQPWEEDYVKGSKWLLHEAFCLDADEAIFHPYEKNHSTVKDACQLAQRLDVQNVILYHTEDSDLAHRKERYAEEGKKYYDGNLYIPDDLTVFTDL